MPSASPERTEPSRVRTAFHADLAVTVTGTDERTARIRCGKDGNEGEGYLQPQASTTAACLTLLMNLPNRNFLIYGEPPKRRCRSALVGEQSQDRATLRGSLLGYRINRTLVDRTDCDAEMWRALGPVLTSDPSTQRP